MLKPYECTIVFLYDLTLGKLWNETCEDDYEMDNGRINFITTDNDFISNWYVCQDILNK